MVNFLIFLALLATTNALNLQLFSPQERSRTSSAIEHGPQPCDPLYEHQGYYNRYLNNNRDKSSGRIDGDNGPREESLFRSLALKEALANAAERRYLEELNGDRGVVAPHHADQVVPGIRESSQPSRRTLGEAGVRFVRYDPVPETTSIGGLSARYPIGAIYPTRTMLDDSQPRGNRLRNRKLRRIVKTILRTEENDHGDTSELDDVRSEPMMYDREDRFETRETNKNVNGNYNSIGGRKERPGFRISRIPLPARSKFDPPPYYPVPRITVIPFPPRSKFDPPPYYAEPRMMDYEDSDSADVDDGPAGVSAVEVETRTNDEDSPEIVEGPENEKTVDTDSLQVEEVEATTPVSTTTEDIEQTTSATTPTEIVEIEPVEIVTTVAPEVTSTPETVLSDTVKTEKTLKKTHKSKNHERFHRKKNRRRRVSKKSHPEPQIHAEKQQDDAPTTIKIVESTTESQVKPEDENKDSESKVEETTTKVDEPKTVDDDKNSELANVSKSPEKESTDGEKSDKLEPQVPEESTEKTSVEDPNGSSVVDSVVDAVVEAKPSSTADAEGSPDGSNDKVTVEDEVTPSRDTEDLQEHNHERKHRTDEEDDKVEPEKIAKGSDLGGLATAHSLNNDRGPTSEETSNHRVKHHHVPSVNSRQMKPGKKTSKSRSTEDLETINNVRDIADNSVQADEHEISKIRRRNHARRSNSNVNKNSNVNNNMVELRHLKEKIDSQSEIPRRNPRKNKLPNRVSGHAKIPEALEPVDSQTYRRSSLRKKSHRNENRNVNTNVNENTIRESGVPNHAHTDDYDVDDERLLEIVANRRNLNRNSNRNQNHIEIEDDRRDSREDSNERVYKIMSNRRALERYINDDVESNENRQINKNANKNVNKNVNDNRNTNRFSEPYFSEGTM